MKEFLILILLVILSPLWMPMFLLQLSWIIAEINVEIIREM